MESRPLLFLDFDGVLHPAMSVPNVLFCHMPLLTEWLINEGAGVDVVISSDWRLDYGFEALKGFFPEAVRPRIRGVLPKEEEVDPEPWGDLPYEAPRQCLIMAWLNLNAVDPGLPWAALDDWQEGFVQDEPRLVAVPEEFGLQRVHLHQVARVLNLAGKPQAQWRPCGRASISTDRAR